jgi:DNA-binding MarR family transcriptional regulator
MNKRLPLTTDDYARLAGFRHAVRAFLHFSEEAAAAAGLTGRHYQALLILRGWQSEEPATINDLAQQLFLKHNSTVGVVDRLEAEGLLAREPSSVDRRKVGLRLTSKGDKVMAQLADRHHAELQRIGAELERFFHDLTHQTAASGGKKP